MMETPLDTPGRRLKWARERAGFKQASDFAKRVPMAAVSYRAYEADQNGFSKRAHDFAEKLGVNAGWLLHGGAMPDDNSFATGDMDEAAKALGLSLVPELELGYSMGGGSIFSDYRHTGFVPFQRDWLRSIVRGSIAEIFVARGEGDSMQPTLLDGDIVLIDTGQRQITQQDRIWAISYGELGMIKRVRRVPGGSYRIMSDNPTVTPIDADDDEMHVVGRVVWIGRRM